MNNHNLTNNMDEVTVILEKIVALQKAAVREELQERFCDSDFLGELECREECNTRPIMLFTDDDEPWNCPVEREEGECTVGPNEKTCVFRAEKVENGVVVLRALEEEERSGRHRKFKSTDSFITIRINNISALRCLKDTFVDLCIR